MLAATLAVAWLPGVGSAEESAEARYARELLLAEVRRAVPLDVPLDLSAPRAALRRDQALLAAPPAGGDAAALAALQRTVAAREVLLGRAGEDPGGGLTWSPGALGEAADLLSWVLGRGECTVRLVAGDLPPGRAAFEVTWPPPPGEGPSAPPGPPDLDAWAAWARERAGGSLLAVRLEAVARAPLTELPAATRRLPAYLPADLPPRPAHVPLDGEGTTFLINEPLLRLRTLQAAERVGAFSKDDPAEGLVDESAVRERALRTDALEEQLAIVRSRRDRVASDLLAMATSAADAWRGLLGALAEQIEGAKAAAGEAADGDLRLRALVAQENAALLEQRLFHISAVHAAETLRRLDRWVALLEGEVNAAQGAESRFSDALVRARRERQLVRLQFERNVRLGPDERAVASEIATLEGTAATDPASARRLATARARRDALEALLAVNEVVLEAVRRRRALVERAVSPGAPPPAIATGPGAPPTPARPDDPDGLAALRSPETSSFDAAYVKAARERLDDPSAASVFDVDLVARHHAAAADRIAALRTALRDVQDVAPLQERHAALATAAEDRIRALAAVGGPVAVYYARVYRQKLEMHAADFADAFKGIEAERTRLAERIAELDAYRLALLSADGRNHGIRVRRSLRPETLEQSAEVLGDALTSARRFLALEGEGHLAAFARDRWAALLGLLAATAAVLLLVRGVRRRLDVAIERRVKSLLPVLAEGGGMSDERARAQQQKERAEEATRAAEEAALRGEPADGPAPGAGGREP